MDPRSAATKTADPDAIEFVRFCYRRRKVGWPELYDEMCAVAGRGLYRGYGADDLAGLGIGFSLFDMPALAVLSARIIAEEQALRRPVRVTITDEAAVPAGMVTESPGVEPISDRGSEGPVMDPSAEERTFDVPVRFSVVPGRA